MTIKSPLITPLLLALAAPVLTAGAAEDAPPEFSAVVDQVIWLADSQLPGDLVQGPVIFGDFDGSKRGEMLSIVDGSVYRTQMPYATPSLFDVDGSLTGVVDAVVLRGISYAGNDLAIGLQSTGLVRLDHSGLLGGIFLYEPIAGSGAWAGATRLIVAPRDAGGADEIWGLVGGDVLVGKIDGATIETTVVLDNVAVPMFDLAVLDQDGDGKTDVAILTKYGVFVYSQEGVLVRRELTPMAVDGRCVSYATVRDVGGTPTAVECLAFWYETGAGSSAKLVVIDGVDTQPTVDLTVDVSSSSHPVNPTCLSAGDHDGDGFPELLMDTGRRFYVMLSNLSEQGSPPPANDFGVGNEEYAIIELDANPTAVVPDSAARPLFADIDYEPGSDILAPAQWADAVVVLTRQGPTTTTTGLGLSQYVYPSAPASGGLIAFETDYTEAHDFTSSNGFEVGTKPTFNLALNIPDGIIDTQRRGFTHLEVVLYHQTGEDSNPAHQFNSMPTQTLVHELETGSGASLPTEQWVPIVAREDASTLVQHDGTELDLRWPNKDQIWVAFRFVKFSSPPPTAGLITQHYADSSRVHFTVFNLKTDVATANDPSTSHLAYLLNLPGNPQLRDYELSDGPDGENAIVGFHIPINLLPALPTTLLQPPKRVGVDAEGFGN